MKEKEWVIKNLESEGFRIPEKVRRAFLKVDRKLFVPQQYEDMANADTPLPIGYGQTISAMHMVLIMTTLLDPEVGDKVLEVGTGSGYQAAILAEIVAPSNTEIKKSGHVYTVERIKELAEFAKENLKKAGYCDRVTVFVGDGSQGLKEFSPYDRIIVTAASPKVPESLKDQLKVGGTLVIPIGSIEFQSLYVIRKNSEKTFNIKKSISCVFVPLIGKEGFDEK
ncbi:MULTISPECIES: protein-L-isoaspartate(D-aspartate) O-methyltransferase [Fervidicoccus]|nr:protein-L-isoaspartate(D-aspartate) O-methyltransferase [Fervidicoccus fontis]